MLDTWEDVERVVYHQGLFYILEIIRTELTTKKTWELVTKKEHYIYNCYQFLLDKKAPAMT